MTLVVRGPLLQTPSPTRLDARPDAVIVVDDDGTITEVHDAADPGGQAALAAAAAVHRVADGSWLLPGLVDLHIHAPQWPQLGTGLDRPLERWLFEDTFPLEARYADGEFARRVWEHLVPSLLATGTTTAVYFATVHTEATTALAATCLAHGQRAFVGRVGMDHPDGTPPWYRDASAAAGVAASAASIEAIRALNGSRSTTPALVQPIVTPRFVPACTDALLAGLGELAAATGTLVQTHCSESDWEHGHVRERCGESDLRALHRVGLATAHTVLAHGTLLDDDDLRMVAGLGAAVAHCPMSNSYFANAVFPARRALELGVRVGLGTDIAGGAHPGVIGQCGMAVTVSRMLEDGVDPRRAPGDRGTPSSRIDATTAFWMGTLGGADALGIPVGLLEVGRQFDAIVVDTTGTRSPLRAWDEVDTPARLLEKIVHLAGPTEVTEVWVAGRRRR